MRTATVVDGSSLIDPDSKEMDACFKKHLAELSENCRRAITAYEATGSK